MTTTVKRDVEQAQKMVSEGADFLEKMKNNWPAADMSAATKILNGARTWVNERPVVARAMVHSAMTIARQAAAADIIATVEKMAAKLPRERAMEIAFRINEIRTAISKDRGIMSKEEKIAFDHDVKNKYEEVVALHDDLWTALHNGVRRIRVAADVTVFTTKDPSRWSEAPILQGSGGRVVRPAEYLARKARQRLASRAICRKNGKVGSVEGTQKKGGKKKR
ncbi:hypothetical protein HY625_00215 [Candidatus Uhrbacteria bacterium]|nr:hypothetical protein [Candidatus Uhrbacteria bacterium]